MVKYRKTDFNTPRSLNRLRRLHEQEEAYDIENVCKSAQTALKKLKTIPSSANIMAERGEIMAGYPHTSPKWPDKAGCSVGTQLAKCKSFDGFLRFTVDGVEYCEPVMMSRPHGKTTKRSGKFV